MRKLVFLGLLLVANLARSQKVKVLDKDTREPIANVAVYNKDNTTVAITDLEGHFDVGPFASSETIYLKHLGYEPSQTTKNRLRKQGLKLYLVIRPEQLEEVVMSVSKWEQQKKDIPNKIVSIDARSIAFAAPQTSADLLQQSGKVFVQKSQLGGGSPMIRGFATNRLVLSVDGVRMNNAIFRGGNLQNVISIDPFTIKNTEIIFGPGSVIYGSDAIGGVMNFYTKSPVLSQNDSLLVFGGANYRFSSANKESTVHAEVQLGNAKWGSYTSVSRSDFGDLKMGSHGRDSYLRTNFVQRIDGQDRLVPNGDAEVQVGSGYDQINLNQKILYRPNANWSAQMGLYFSETSNFARYDRLIRPSRDGLGLRSAEWFYGPQRWFMGNLQVNKQGNGQFYDRVKLTAAYQNFHESRNNRDFGGPILNTTKEHVDAINLNVDFENKKMGAVRLYYGTEYIYNKVHSQGIDNNVETGSLAPAPARYPDGSTWKSLAGYINGEYRVKPNVTLLSGFRYSHVWVDALFDRNFYDFPFETADLSTGALTGSIGFSWFPKRNLQVTFNGSTGFRAPNIDDIGKIFDSEPGSVVVPNPNLEPEYAYNAEIGIQKNFNDKVVLKGATYYTYLVDALVRRDFSFNGTDQILYGGELSNVQAIQNAARAYVYGFEFGADAYLNEHWSLSANLTLTEGIEEEEDGTDSPARHAAPTFGDFHVLWKGRKVKTDLFVNFNGEIAFEDLALSERAKDYIYAQDANGNPFSPSWYTVNFRSQYDYNNRLTFSLHWENMTDQRYRTYSSGIVAPGSNFVLGASLAF